MKQLKDSRKEPYLFAQESDKWKDIWSRTTYGVFVNSISVNSIRLMAPCKRCRCRDILGPNYLNSWIDRIVQGSLVTIATISGVYVPPREFSSFCLNINFHIDCVIKFLNRECSQCTFISSTILLGIMHFSSGSSTYE